MTLLVSDDVKQLGFSIVIDMRGSTWHNVKPILKVLQECFPHKVYAAYIIKPEKFWEKQKTSLGSAKYKFETVMISVEHLGRLITPSQLTDDLHGTLPYDNQEWVEIRMLLEDFTAKSHNLLERLNELRSLMMSSDLPDDVSSAKLMIEENNDIQQKVSQAPVEMLETKGRTILDRIHGSCSRQSSRQAGSSMCGNADFQKAAPQISQLLEMLRSSRQQLMQLWHARKSKLEQCFQLRIFEADVEKLVEDVNHQRELFLVNYTEIGNGHGVAAELQMEHEQFAAESLEMYTNISQVMSVAHRLCDAGHYAAPAIRLEASRLDKNWRTFATALEDRSSVLRLSVIFHKKAEEYMCEVPEWKTLCDSLQVPDEVPSLEDAIQAHQTLIERITQAYTQLCAHGKTLLDALQTPVSSGSNNSITAKADYSNGATHVLDVVHEVFAHHRDLEQLWHTGKVRLHQRLSLRLFQQDMKQVSVCLPAR
ncbi:hypothetical protein NP493_107g06017 [Ridgeia piscesae]|uniref:CRAL-TRIO domain-containing protein n=1 Tax=Ridgeia piscesae TaxID=27915 RepID=A0AAD9P768_RIDPI|nr:hypothetical protein NP493_107g06017 [Ridgeia piscesae]